MSLRLHNHQKLHDPTYIGPGIWFNMHLDAVMALTKSDQMAVIRRIRILQSRFPCSKCKIHFGEYLERHPPEQICGQSADSLFQWSVDFHNAVNSFTDKSQVSYQDARNIYQEESIFCTADCSDTTEPEPAPLSESRVRGVDPPLGSRSLAMPMSDSMGRAPLDVNVVLKHRGRSHGTPVPQTSSGISKFEYQDVEFRRRGGPVIKHELGYVLIPVGPRR
jgi:hypothetical protein